MPPGPHQRDLAELATADVFIADLHVVRAGALLHSDLTDAVVYPRGLDDARPFVDGERERLLDVNVAAGIQGIDGAGGVPVVGRPDEHCVDFLLLEQRPVVGVGLRLRGHLLQMLEVVAEDIAEGDNFRLAGLKE